MSSHDTWPLRQLLLVAALAAVMNSTSLGWAKCADRTIIVSGIISGEAPSGLTLALAILSNSPGGKWEGVRQEVSVRDNEFTITGHFDPTEAEIDNVCSRRPVLVSVSLKRTGQIIAVKELHVRADFRENVHEQTYTLNKQITLHAGPRPRS
jgi:hypothetical protein